MEATKPIPGQLTVYDEPAFWTPPKDRCPHLSRSSLRCERSANHPGPHRATSPYGGTNYWSSGGARP